MLDQKIFFDGIRVVEIVQATIILIEVGEIPVVAVLVDRSDVVGTHPTDDLCCHGGLAGTRPPRYSDDEWRWCHGRINPGQRYFTVSLAVAASDPSGATAIYLSS